MKSKIAIFASGQGSNARRLIEFFRNHSQIEVDCIVCNRKEAGVFEVAKEFGIASFYLPKEEFEEGENVVKLMLQKGIDWIVLAGFLLKIPHEIVDAFNNRIINIHPALLPKFGGKGMYGDHVHNAVLSKGEKKSGISIHFVDQHYDTGNLIAQFECPIEQNENLGSLKYKIQQLEHKYLPEVIEKLLLESKRKGENRV